LHFLPKLRTGLIHVYQCGPAFFFSIILGSEESDLY
jgi:hypothetical protein